MINGQWVKYLGAKPVNWIPMIMKMAKCPWKWVAL